MLVQIQKKYFGEEYTPEGTVENRFSGPINKPDMDRLESWFPSMTGKDATRIRGYNPLGKGPFHYQISDEEREEGEIENIMNAIRSGYNFADDPNVQQNLNDAIYESKWRDMNNQEYWNRRHPMHEQGFYNRNSSNFNEGGESETPMGPAQETMGQYEEQQEEVIPFDQIEEFNNTDQLLEFPSLSEYIPDYVPATWEEINEEPPQGQAKFGGKVSKRKSKKNFVKKYNEFS